MTDPPGLVSAAAGGDDEALSALVRTYHDRVYRYGVRVCRDGHDADDAVQEAFAKLAHRADVMRHQGVLKWLMTVVRNACFRMLRPFLRERRALGERIADADTLATGEADPRVALERWELVQAVHAAIATLERPFREVLVMRDLEGWSGDETSAALGLTRAAMKTRLHRARTMLRAALQQRGVGELAPAVAAGKPSARSSGPDGRDRDSVVSNADWQGDN